MKAKRLSKAQRLDIITTLPQAIIEIILCLLPIEEAARTSILSREWRYKWTTIPKLVFLRTTVKRPTEEIHGKRISECARREKEMRCKLINTIHQVLLLRQGPIQEFTLLMEATETCFEIDQIILHLSRNHTIKKLTFDFDYYSSYSLPLTFFSLHHLTDLYLKNCHISHKPIFSGFGSLTRLSLRNTRISRETLLHLLSNCPSLKRLCMLIDDNYYGYESPSIVELFNCLPVIEHLTIWGYNIGALVDQAAIPQKLPSSLIRLKYFSLKQMWFHDSYDLPFLAVLIKCSPNLEKIKLEIADHDIESVKLEKYSDVWLENLNELEIKYFTIVKPVLQFVKFILAKSPNLKKVRLETFMVNKNEKLEMLKTILCSPRASLVEIVVRVE